MRCPKVTTGQAWFAAWPNGNEDNCEIYPESREGRAHLKVVMKTTQDVVTAAIKKGGA